MVFVYEYWWCAARVIFSGGLFKKLVLRALTINWNTRLKHRAGSIFILYFFRFF